MVSTPYAPQKVMRPKAEQLRLKLIGIDSSFTLIGGYAISAILVENTTANAMTSGLNIGTTDGGSDVCSAFAVGANFIGHIPEAVVLKRYWSRTVNQLIFVTAVGGGWNGALLNVTLIADKISP
jgi:hypothetical protein